MRDANVVMSKKERKASEALLRISIQENQKKVASDVNAFKACAKTVKAGAKDYNDAAKAFKKKNSTKNQRKLTEAQDDLWDRVSAYRKIGASIEDGLQAIRNAYTELDALAPDKKAGKALDELDKYEASIKKQLDAINREVNELVDIDIAPETEEVVEVEEEEELTLDDVVEDAYVPEEPVVEEKPAAVEVKETPVAQPAPQVAPQAAPAPQMPCYPMFPGYAPVAPNVFYNTYLPGYAAPAPQAAPAPVQEAEAPKVAPATIDVSDIVEKAIAATMEKFTAAFDKKLEAFVAEHPVNIPMPEVVAVPAPVAVEPAVTPKAGEILEIEANLLENEKGIFDKLVDMTEKLSAFQDTMTKLYEQYVALVANQNEVDQMLQSNSKKQSDVVRDQQAVQIKLDAIIQDQYATKEATKVLQNQQRELNELQNAITNAQNEIAARARVIADTQVTIDESMNAIVAAQKDIIATQQSINAGNKKNADSQAEVIERQGEALELQKEALAAQKQILREQKALSAKQKDLTEASPKKKAPARKKAEEAAPVADVAEAPVAETVEAPVADDSKPAEEA